MVKTYPILLLIKIHRRTRRSGQISVSWDQNVPVPVYVTGIDIVGALQASDWLQTDAGCLIGHDVYQSVLEFVTRQVGCDKPGRVSFGVRQSLDGERKCECHVIMIFLNFRVNYLTTHNCFCMQEWRIIQDYLPGWGMYTATTFYNLMV